MGTRRLVAVTSYHLEDHPHACGDKLLLVIKSFMLLGSSPRVWGQAPGEVSEAVSCRIIPTRVGTSAKIDTLSLKP